MLMLKESQLTQRHVRGNGCKSLTIQLTKKVNKHAIKWTLGSVSNLHTVFGSSPALAQQGDRGQQTGALTEAGVHGLLRPRCDLILLRAH